MASQFDDMMERVSKMAAFDDKFFEDHVMPFLEKFFGQALDGILKIAPVMGKLTKSQLARVKKVIKRMGVDSDHAERIHLYGKGLIPEYLARAEKTLRAGTWRTLQPHIRKALWDGEKVVDVQYKAGVRGVPLRSFTRMEWYQCLDEQGGLRSIEDQRKAYFKPTKKPTRTEKEVARYADAYNSLVPGRKAGLVTMVGRNSRGEMSSAIEFPLDAVRRILGAWHVE